MQKDHLPKLELDGFVTSGGNAKSAAPQRGERDYSKWRARAQALAGKAGLRIEWGGARPRPDDEIDIGYKRLLVKTGICAALAIAILIIGTVTAPGAGNGVKADSHAASQEFDIPEDIGKLKFVESLDDVTSVMSVLPDDAAVYPSDGEVVTAFGQAGSCGVRFGAADGTVYSIARGTVAATGEIGGEGYVKTLLDTGETVLYVGLDPLVQTDDIVQPGQIIGTVTADYLYVEMKQGETYVDPAAYIAARAAEGSGAS